MTLRQLQEKLNEIASYADDKMDEDAVVWDENENRYLIVDSVKAVGDFDRPVPEGNYIIIA